MLSAFPILFSFAVLVPSVLRILLAGIYTHWAISNGARSGAPFGSGLGQLVRLGTGAGALFLFFGLYTQPVAFVIAGLPLAALIARARGTESSGPVGYYLLLLITTVALAFLGPGAFAIDYPL